jgi:hypothetical protein
MCDLAWRMVHIEIASNDEDWLRPRFRLVYDGFGCRIAMNDMAIAVSLLGNRSHSASRWL